MPNAILALALLATPAIAEDVTRAEWGQPTQAGGGRNALTLSPCDFPCLAVIRFDNTLIAGRVGSVDTFTLDLAGLPVVVTVEGRNHRRPEVLSVIAPPGAIAEPPTLIVADDASGEIRLLAPLSF